MTFTPSHAARTPATLTFDSTNGNDFVVHATGDGVALETSIAPANQDYGRYEYPAQPNVQLVLLNRGDMAQTITGIAIDHPTEFRVSGLAVGDLIDAGETRAFGVQLTPTTLGQHHATLTVSVDHGPDIVVTLDAAVTTFILEVTTLDATPDDHVLGLTVDVNNGPGFGRIRLHSKSGAPQVFDSCTIVGDAGFSIVSGCPVTLETVGTAELAIAYDPTAASTANATLLLTGSGFPTGALRLRLSGTGIVTPEMGGNPGDEDPGGDGDPGNDGDPDDPSPKPASSGCRSESGNAGGALLLVALTFVWFGPRRRRVS